MNAMLEAWGQQPVTDSGGMGTMDEMGGMSGMMSQEDMTALEEAQGTEAAQHLKNLSTSSKNPRRETEFSHVK